MFHFIPQLVAGPVMRDTTLLPQFREQHKVDTQRRAGEATRFLGRKDRNG